MILLGLILLSFSIGFLIGLLVTEILVILLKRDRDEYRRNLSILADSLAKEEK